MKKLLFTVALIFVSAHIFAQNDDNFSIILSQNAADAALVTKLENFKAGGIEKELNLDSISVQQIIDTALSYKGTPHCMGGVSHSCIDCSGLLYMTFKSNGVDVPHSSQELARYGSIIIDADSLQRGDLVFFIKTYNTSKVITHSGIFLGDGEFIHTSASRGVVISKISSSYYQNHYIFGTRVF